MQKSDNHALQFVIFLLLISSLIGCNHLKAKEVNVLNINELKIPKDIESYNFINEIGASNVELNTYRYIQSTNSVMLSYGHKQFLSLNGLGAAWKKGNHDEQYSPIWLSWSTEAKIIAEQKIESTQNVKSVLTCPKNSKNPYTRYLSLDKTPQGHYLVDDNKNLIRYEVILSPLIEEYIKSYKTKNTPVNFIPGTKDKFGSMALKLAWKELTEEDDISRYFIQDAFMIKNGECEKSKVALISMHMVYKTEKLTDWIWSTFSHIDNAPLAELNPGPGNKYIVNQTQKLLRKWNLYSNNTTSTLNSYNTNDPLSSAQIADVYKYPDNNVFAKIPETEYQYFVENIDSFNKLSPWRYYRQEGSQWIQKMDETDYKSNKNNILIKQCDSELYGRFSGCPIPKLLSNVALEPYEQSTSCVSCHQPSLNNKPQSQQSFDFIFLPPQLFNKGNKND
ncbi:hypothetical protein [Pseudoalteromonas denitrificans]|uniref:Uncharacterized protein n=1 Tax=Pseudoalteromonas denitrificans DSM 6059 TaxID=1123010 RepID=A0A1I1TXZ4_9GAMM|nr:hypothetical protein [Pseudoalteromonas denitrificans]SFD63359.1 hypothetical protein SAMN02745724_05038 [Pseudoalteromonas denitrificans DSM 6059]